MSDTERGDSRHIKSGILNLFSGPGTFSAPSLSESPIIDLLNEANKTKRDQLVEKWRDHKLQELNFVGVVAALLTGCLTSTGSWPNILAGDDRQPWQIRTCWYVGIIFGLASILSAAGQTIRLHRISAHQEAPTRLRLLLKGKARRTNGYIIPSRFRMYIWQLPVVFLTCAVVCMIVGIWVLVWTATIERGSFVWKANSKSAVVFTIFATLVSVVFVMGQRALHMPIHEMEDVDE
ncbi:hypothetical protein EJ08DRAFT_702330 [Tothia fuscella]|uniref:Uncharacterized protein n=1 Tax=Tothia fuscella TaxID=1048955 RepID=A0A9P4NH15_9PEZI|nr:hypothetical protein EJ08DRAFT_702330 [Tothia fuscella]